MRLTNPQLESLRASASESGYYAHDSYPPTKKLAALGLVEAYPLKFGRVRFHITDAGRDVLAGRSPALMGALKTLMSE